MSSSPCDIVQVVVQDPESPVVQVVVHDEAPDITALLVSDGVASPVQFTGFAAAVLSSNCYVALNADGELIRADGPLGIAAQGFVSQSAAIGDVCTVTTAGIANGFSGLSPSATLFLGSDGQVTETPPETGVVQQVGAALTASRISISIFPPVERA